MSRRISPGLRSGSLPILAALMTMLGGFALAGLTGVQTLASEWLKAAQSAATIEIPSDIPNFSARKTKLLLSFQNDPNVLKVDELSSEQTQDLLAPWLGKSENDKKPLFGLTLPKVIIVSHKPTAHLEGILNELIPEATLQEDMQWGDRLNQLGNSLVVCAWFTVLLIMIVAVLSIGITVRRSVASQKRATEIVHSLGVADFTISSHIAGHTAILCFLGSLTGLIFLAPITIYMAEILAPFSQQAIILHNFPLSFSEWKNALTFLPSILVKELVFLPIIATLLGWITAQGVVLSWLRRLP
ncbi:cell division protein FtsX [Swingsia samuiensis]|uniref:Cell division protein FtsX n=1 Tax=Swingsia samuiensis TaxID=1293412 RepID=A0A4Y6UFQ9_9PROT|nr:FtsX-like permease family protein [Swingsia samuiensis]QDH16393.1 cell division protein FtsX [Swingsia samuiensis]